MSSIFPIPGPWKGRLAIALRPRGGDWLPDDVQALRREGIDVIVSLLEPDEAAQLELGAEEQVAENQGLRFLSFPIPDRGTPESLSDSLKLFGAIKMALDGGKNVAVHCRQSVGRAGMIAAGMLEVSGIEASLAISQVSAARGVEIPETPAQTAWLKALSGRSALVR